jgi:hypothetical protein
MKSGQVAMALVAFGILLIVAFEFTSFGSNVTESLRLFFQPFKGGDSSTTTQNKAALYDAVHWLNTDGTPLEQPEVVGNESLFQLAPIQAWDFQPTPQDVSS